MVKPFIAEGAGSIPGWEAKIPHAVWPKNQNINNGSNILTNSLKTLKMVHIKKKSLKKKTSDFWSYTAWIPLSASPFSR